MPFDWLMNQRAHIFKEIALSEGDFMDKHIDRIFIFKGGKTVNSLNIHQ